MNLANGTTGLPQAVYGRVVVFRTQQKRPILMPPCHNGLLCNWAVAVDTKDIHGLLMSKILLNSSLVPRVRSFDYRMWYLRGVYEGRRDYMMLAVPSKLERIRLKATMLPRLQEPGVHTQGVNLVRNGIWWAGGPGDTFLIYIRP